MVIFGITYDFSYYFSSDLELRIAYLNGPAVSIGARKMDSEAQINIFQWLEDVFGWTWKIAGLFSIYYLSGVLFFEESGLPLFVAFSIFSLCKWANNMFRILKLRVEFEAKMMKQGFTQEQATRAWQQTLNRKS